MHNIMKKTSSWILVFAMMIFVLPIVAFASDVTVLDSQIKVSDSAGKISVSGNTVTAKASGFSSSKTNTINVYNNGSTKAQIVCNYAASGDISSFSESSYNGTLDVMLEAGAAYTFTIVNTKKTLQTATATLVLDGFQYTPVVDSASIIVYHDSIGSVTVDGNAVANGGSTQIGAEANLVATPANGASFVAWVNKDTNHILSQTATYTLKPSASSMNVWAVFSKLDQSPYYKVGTTLYETYADAKAAAVAGSDKTIVVISNGTIDESIEIPNGVSMLLPYSSVELFRGVPQEWTLDKFSLTASNFPDPPETSIVNAKVWSSTSNVEYRKVILAEGNHITVNGSLEISGQTHPLASGQWGNYALLQMSSNSSITVGSTGKLYVYGFIRGNGTVTVESSGEIYEHYDVADYPPGGAGGLDPMNEAGVFGLTNYTFNNVEVPTTYKAGAKMKAYMVMTGYNIGTNAFLREFIGSSSDAVFNLKSGTLTKTFTGGRQKFDFANGASVDLNKLYININATIVNYTVDSSKTSGMPLSHNWDISITGNSTATLNCSLLMYAGSTVTVENGSKIVVPSGVKLSLLDPTSDPSGVTSDAVIDLNGEIETSGGFYTSTKDGDLPIVKSSKGTGRVTVNAVGTETTFNVRASGDNTAAVDIVPAKLQNEYTDNGALSSVTETNATGTYNYDAAHKRWVKSGHIFTDVVTKPTCQAGGYTTHTCTCGYVVVDSQTDAIPCSDTDPLDGGCDMCGDVLCEHINKIVVDDAKDPTCTEKGVTAGEKCADCGAIIVAQEEIPALGHTSADEWLGNDDNTKHYKICVVCSEIAEEAGHTGGIATCVAVKVCEVCKIGYGTVDTINGHAYGDVIYGWTDFSACTATHSCSVCTEETEGHTQTAQAAITSEVTKAATCTETGVKTYIATFGVNWAETQTTTETIEINSTAHADANKDHKCDNGCDVVQGTCEDKNNDHICDYGFGTEGGCTVVHGTCSDSNTDKDHVCDYGCGKEWNACSDTATDGDHKCDICDKADVTTCGDSNKDHVCDSDSACEKYSTGGNVHADSDDANHTCDYCGGAVAGEVCVDGNNDHKCDECTEAISTCVDVDKNHECDFSGCKAAMGTHTNGTNTHICTYCGQAASECADATGDKDHKCDVCGAENVTTCTAGEAKIENNYDPTCEVDGSYDTVTYCTECGAELSRVNTTVSAKGHNYDKIVTAPTCSSAGYTTYTCVCGDTYTTDEVAATGHSYTEEVTKVATCTATGVKTYACACGDSYTEEIAATGHTLTRIDAKAATCTEVGYEAYEYCSECEYTTYKEVTATGHNWNKATCTAPKTCGACGATEGEAVGHSYNESVTKQPTCTEKGEKTFTCHCGDSYTEAIEASGHNYETIVIEPTCTADGYTMHTCTVCGDSYNDGQVSASGHKYTEEVTRAPTCTEDGMKTFTCGTCGDSYTKEVAALGHDLKDVAGKEASCTEDGWDAYVSCSRCDYTTYTEKIALGHDWIAATHETPMTCDRCKITAGAPLVKVETPEDVTIDTSDELDMEDENVKKEVEELTEAAKKAVIQVVQPEESGVNSEGNKQTVDNAKDKVKDENGNSVAQDKVTHYSTTLTIKLQNVSVGKDNKGAASVKKFTYDVTPYLYAMDENGAVVGQTKLNDFEEEIIFHLPVPGSTDAKYAKVWHDGEQMGYYEIKRDEQGNAYVEVSSKNFSEFATEDHTHVFTGAVTAAATCTTDGVMTYTCECGKDTYTEVIPATNHANTEIVNAKDATCGAAGYTGDTYCNDCKTTIKTGTAIPATGAHSYDGGVVTKEPTTTTVGERTYTCSVCGHSYTEEIPMVEVVGITVNFVNYTKEGTNPDANYQATVKVGDTTVTGESGVAVEATLGTDGKFTVSCPWACVALVETTNQDGTKSYDKLLAVATAMENTYEFIVASPSNDMIIAIVHNGDVNTDGTVNTADRVAIARSIYIGDNPNLYKALSAMGDKIADVNFDGNVNTADRVAVARSIYIGDNTNLYKALNWAKQ